MNKLIGFIASCALIGLVGCSSSQKTADYTTTNAVEKAATMATDVSSQATTGLDAAGNAVFPTGDMYPPNARAGECYARVNVPAKTEPVEETIVLKEASEKIETIEATFEEQDQVVILQEERIEYKTVPATYKVIEEQIEVKAASTKLVTVPAVYETQEEQVLKTPARKYWKQGTGPVTKVDEATGEILCLVEEPAVYETVKKTVLVTPETTQEVEVPAVYETFKKKVIDEPARTEEVIIPAITEVRKVKVMVNPPTSTVTTIPAETKVVTRDKIVQESSIEWQSILCKTNTTPGVVTKLQQALSDKGYNPGGIDGVMGSQTLRAVSKYQADNGLASGGLTMETLQHLNLAI